MHRLDYVCITVKWYFTQHAFQNQVNLKDTYTICRKFQIVRKKYVLTHINSDLFT